MAEPRPTSRAARPSLLTPAFAALCLTALLGYTHHSLLLPTVPLFVDEKGGSPLLAGLVLLSFSVPSFLIRPYFGKLADAWSAAGVLIIGLLALTAGGLIYLTGLLAMLFVAGVVRGFGWGALNTGGYTLLANAAPAVRRGEAAGYYSAATASAPILFPAVALWLIDRPSLGFESVFILAAGAAGVGVVLAQFVLTPITRGQQPTRPTAAAADPATGLAALLDRRVMPATLLNLSTNLAFPAVTAFLPLYARELEIGNVALFYVIGGGSSILIRPLLGRSSDTLGRGRLIGAGFVLQLCGLTAILLASSLTVIIAGGVLTALGNAVNTATTTALAMDLADPAQRGRAMATFSASFQIGQGFGAILAGGLADLAGFRSMYAGSIAIICLGFVILRLNWPVLSRAIEPQELRAQL